MKSRSHRLPVSEPHHEDWVDGSWTVDCVCGVNYDDGEEMVGCDECGVWVHTRCFHFVKSEKSFACDKCKSKNSAGGVPDDSEETEVAEFLVELPTKTLRMDNPNPASVVPRRQFRLWTGIPAEDRGHVQGVPGGEPGLFSSSGMSSIFSPELWKSTGYIPKKFNFRYSEFPNQGTVKEEEDKVLDKTRGEENGNQADSGAGVLFSLLKDSNKTLPSQAVDSGGVRSQVEGIGVHEVSSLRQKKNLVGEGQDFSGPEDSVKKENNSSVHIVLPFGKHKKEKLGMLKGQSAKKVRTVEEYKDSKKRAADSTKAASTSSSDVKCLEFSQDRVSKPVSTHCGPNVIPDQQADHHGECGTNLSSKEHGLGVSQRNDATSDEILKKENREDRVSVRSDKFTKTSNRVESLAEPDGSLRQPVKEESVGGAGYSKISTRYKDPMAVDGKVGCSDAKESQLGQSSDIDDSNTRPNKKFKGDLTADDLQPLQVKPLPPNDVKLNSMKIPTNCPDSCVKTFSEEGRVTETSLISSEASNQRVPTAIRSLLISSSRTDKSDESPGNPCQYKQQHTTEGSAGVRKKSSGLKHNLEVADELHKSNGTAKSNSTASYQRKGVSLVKSTSTSGSNFSKPSDNHVTTSTQNPSPVHSRQNGLSDSTVGTVKDSASANVIAREEKSGGPKKLVKEYSRHFPKIPDTTKLSHMSDSKKPSSDSKGLGIHSSKVPLVTNAANNHVSGECTSPPQVESASNPQSKTLFSAEPGRVEKQSQSGGHHSSSRGNVAPVAAPTPANVPATLRDEELALLLHQELNSSPRVPRVPRMRHAGSLPQLAGPSATSVLMKRTSSGGKDHNVVSRRRAKDFSGEFSHGSVEVDKEAKKVNRKPTSPDNRKRDSGYNADTPTRREADGRARIVQSVKKSNTGSGFSSSSNANGHNLSSGRPLSRPTSDDDPRNVGRQTTRTLPGLIAEIMREGKRMTYEELCNAVLPHWPHLRKHNGERYAYSSHSQAVLDCLRNRNEWARLVDRGPKSAPGRKRRKLDGDSLSIESEDNEEKGAKNAKMSGSKSFESPREDFPKGKRKARKRRRLVPRRRADFISDDESEEFSSSSEENSTSGEKEEEEEDDDDDEEEEEAEEEEAQGGSEASASSDDI